MLRLRGPVRSATSSGAEAPRRKPAPAAAPAPAKKAAAKPAKPADVKQTPAPEAPREATAAPSEKPMVQPANFAAKSAPAKPQETEEDKIRYAEARAAAAKLLEEKANPSEAKKKFRAGKTNPLLSDDATVSNRITQERVNDRVAPKTPTDVKAAFVDSSTRARLARVAKAASGELVNIDPEYFDAILSDFPVVAQNSKIHGTGLFAKTALTAGAEIFTETPFALVADVDNKKDTFCDHCLRALEKVRPFTKEELKEEYNMQGVDDSKIETPPELPDNLVEQLLKKSELSQPGRCECPACKTAYCSEKCRDEAKEEYHPVLCNNPHLKLIGGQEKGNHNMTNLLMRWWARLEIILAKERVNPFDNDFGRLNFDKSVMNQPLTTQEDVLLMNARSMFPSLATTKIISAQGLQVCKSILNHNSYDFSAYRIGLRVVRKSDALNDIKQMQGAFELPADALPPTITIGKGKSAKNDWVVMPAISGVSPIRGYALHVLASYFNHSCAPNVVPMPSFNNEVTFVTIENLTKGDELTINYIGSMTNADRATRQRVIKERFHFECNCPRCRAEAKIEM